MAKKSIVLFSGGWESTLCLQHSMNHHSGTIPVFFNYGQQFFQQELAAATGIAAMLRAPIALEKLPALVTSGAVFSGRNLRMLLHVVDHYAPQVVYIGARAPSPMFDPYGDSNTSTLKAIGRACGVKVCTLPPLPKWMVKQLVHKELRSHVWSSENWNNLQKEKS